MKFSYYPGCSLDGTAREYGESLESVAETLDLELEELRDWTCCGASSGHVTSDELGIALAARNVIIADQAGKDLLVPCAACFLRLKAADKQLRTGKKIEGISHNYQGKFTIKHSTTLFREIMPEKTLAAKVKKPLNGLNVVCYYGCLVTRPPKITDAKNPEDPQDMDELMTIMGATVKNWSYKTDCCGGNLILTHPDIARNLIKKLLDMAEEAGADCIVVGCPMCQSNLDTRQKEIIKNDGKTYSTPIFYFTELMGLAFGDLAAPKWLNRHFTDTKALLKQKGLL